MFAELYRQRRDLGDVNRSLAAVVGSSDDAIISKDLDGIVATFNQGAEGLSGYKAEEVVGKPMTIWIHRIGHMKSRKSLLVFAAASGFISLSPYAVARTERWSTV
jgi:PAS domain-containing protein